jgi:hypothetical protein
MAGAEAFRATPWRTACGHGPGVIYSLSLLPPQTSTQRWFSLQPLPHPRPERGVGTAVRGVRVLGVGSTASVRHPQRSRPPTSSRCGHRVHGRSPPEPAASPRPPRTGQSCCVPTRCSVYLRLRLASIIVSADTVAAIRFVWTLPGEGSKNFRGRAGINSYCEFARRWRVATGSPHATYPTGCEGCEAARSRSHEPWPPRVSRPGSFSESSPAAFDRRPPHGTRRPTIARWACRSRPQVPITRLRFRRA